MFGVQPERRRDVFKRLWELARKEEYEPAHGKNLGRVGIESHRAAHVGRSNATHQGPGVDHDAYSHQTRRA